MQYQQRNRAAQLARVDAHGLFLVIRRGASSSSSHAIESFELFRLLGFESESPEQVLLQFGVSSDERLGACILLDVELCHGHFLVCELRTTLALKRNDRGTSVVTARLGQRFGQLTQSLAEISA
jgi:hypothetical protein